MSFLCWSEGEKVLKVNRINKKFQPDCSRVIIKPHIPKDEMRIKRLVARVLDMNEEIAKSVLTNVIQSFACRHKNIWSAFEQNYDKIKEFIPQNITVSNTKRALLGAYFSMEYSVQAAAFFNPSIVPHPDQNNLEEGSLRFILSFRSVGEGHISSIEFRSGCVDKNCNFTFDNAGHYAECACTVNNQCQGTVLSDYEVQFSCNQELSEKVIYPMAKCDCNGIEDARFVKFVDDDSDVTYYATYTAYDGVNISPQLLETKDFINFKMSKLEGEFSKNKGMALFPRKISGKYVMVSRVDGENLYIMTSDDIHCWQNATFLREPENAWEFVQIGNCGSPIETDYGWILLTHGVGPMRQYCIGITLLDIDEPSKVLNNMIEPLIIPTEEEREGYVPNVVYSCGAIVHKDNLVIPYAMSDTCSGIITTSVSELFTNTEIMPSKFQSPFKQGVSTLCS